MVVLFLCCGTTPTPWLSRQKGVPNCVLCSVLFLQCLAEWTPLSNLFGTNAPAGRFSQQPNSWGQLSCQKNYFCRTVTPSSLILGMFLTSIESTERAVAQPSPLCHNETLAPACCGFSERPLCPPGHQPWSQRGTYAETVGQPASYPEVAQEEGEGLSCYKQ